MEHRASRSCQLRHASASAAPSAAVQNEAEGQDTDTKPSPPDWRPWLAVRTAESDQELPLYVNDLLALSTAMQNDADGHDTAVKPPNASTFALVDHVPLYVNTPPALPTAMHSDTEGHDTQLAGRCSRPGCCFPEREPTTTTSR